MPTNIKTLSNIRTLYKLYVHIRESRLPDKQQTNLMRALFSVEEWCQLAHDSEKCRLVTKEENSKENVSDSDIIPFDNHNFEYFTNQQIGYRFRQKEEGALLKELALKHLNKNS